MAHNVLIIADVLELNARQLIKQLKMNKEQKVQNQHVSQHSSNEMLAAVVSDATHLLWCRHCIGRQCKEYLMACIPLGLSKGGKMKVLVFGDRNWKGYDHIKKIRYVEPDRVIVNGG